VHRDRQEAANTVVTMLRTFSRQCQDTYGLASAKTQTLEASFERLNTKKIETNIVLGFGFSEILPEDRPELFTSNDFALAFGGRIYSPTKTTDVQGILKKLRSTPEKIASAIMLACNGAYAFVAIASDSLTVGRDTLGLMPLYFGNNDTLYAFASERKALWKIGFDSNDVKSFPPGNIGVIRKNMRLSLKRVKTLRNPAIKPINPDFAVRRLRKFLLQSMKDRVFDTKEVVVAFSGGLDSSLVAFLAKQCGAKVLLITVGLGNTPETKQAEEAAMALHMPTQVKTYTINDVEKALPKVLSLIEEPNLLNASIAIPLYWTAEAAAAHGLNVLFAGQGADELFGGYHRYLNIYAEKGVDAVQEALFKDVVNCYASNFQRDTQTCAGLNVELRLPFADLNLIKFALSLPLSLKIESPTDKLRKRVLRKTAEEFGLPEFIVKRAKKAVQYATGVDKALRKLAKKENLNPSSYVRKVFREVFPDVKPND
jgi:asparagine synthase (glutamine-hydrolysing)